MDSALEFLDGLDGLDAASVAPGRTEIDGDKLYLLCQEYKTKPIRDAVWENHRRYADIHYIAKGVETIQYNNPENLNVTEPYNEDNDSTLYSGEGMPLTLRVGQFLIAYPDDAHMVCVHGDQGPHDVKKIVVKILLEQ